MQKLIDWICKGCSFLMVLFLAMMVLMVFGNVVLRYGFNSGITASEELSRWLFVWLTFLGAVVAVRKHTHLGTDALLVRLPVAGRKVCLVLSHVLMLYLCWLMFRGALQQAEINLDTTSSVMQVSMVWFYGSGVVFACAAALILAHELWKLLTGQLSDADLIGVRESEEMPHGQSPSAAE